MNSDKSNFLHPAAQSALTRYRSYYQLPTDCVQEQTFLNVWGTDVFVQCYCPDTPCGTVLLLHGYFDHAGALAPLISFLTEHKYQVYTLDFPGHGLSEGERYSIPDFSYYEESVKQTINWMMERELKPFHIIGHSTGAGIAAKYALTYKDPMLKRVELVAPLLRSSHWHLSRVAHALTSSMINQVPRKFRPNSGDTDYLKRQQQDPLQDKFIPLEWLQALFNWEKEVRGLQTASARVSIIQGVKDRTVDWKHNINFYKNLFPNSHVFLIDEGQHQLLNEKASIRQMVYELIIQRLNNEGT
ncbi:alpha/beta hydrolase [Salsuginibacillus kocurii]|uniref:alpha/beta hydrolase n=1 Tax=Salsuginibacillus kocurii TaxID=427078 RepID=UPI00035D41E4|nr:alpha/beta hydrolase [Salsuginibacillus kocurii]